MPSAETMLFAYQKMIRDSRGQGLVHLAHLADAGRQVRELLDLVNADYQEELARAA